MSPKSVVGIFSRDDQSCYEWLTAFLLDSSLVKDVRPVYIPACNLIHEVNQCSFAILYHTKNRGRVNVVNVTDSLYDEELETLSHLLGKKNVIVIIDDLEDISKENKSQILVNQPSIGELAQDLFLFSSTYNSFLDDKRSSTNSQRNLQEIRHIIKAHNKSMLCINFDKTTDRHFTLIVVVAVCIVILLFIALIILAVIKTSHVTTPTASPWNITTATAAATPEATATT